MPSARQASRCSRLLKIKLPLPPPVLRLLSPSRPSATRRRPSGSLSRAAQDRVVARQGRWLALGDPRQEPFPTTLRDIRQR
jgi:hypothetical protein